MKRKKLLLLCLATMLLSALVICSGCGKDQNSANLPSFIYIADYVDMPKSISSMDNMCFIDDTIYFCEYGKISTQEPLPNDPKPGDDNYWEGMYDLYGYKLSKVNLDGSGYETLTNYESIVSQEGNMHANNSIVSLRSTADNTLWICENVNYYSYDAQGNWQDGGSQNFVRQLDLTGKELQRIDISSLQNTANTGEYFYISQMQVDDTGNIYLACNDTGLKVILSGGQASFDITSDGGIGNVLLLSDGSVAACGWGNEGLELKKVDLESKSFGEAISLPNRAYNLFNGGGEYDVYYQDSNNLFGYNVSKQESVKLINWIDSDIDSNNMGSILPLNDGRIIATIYDYSYTSSANSIQLAVMSKHDRSEIAEKETITLAAMWLDSNIRSQIIKFNRSNPDYRIQVTDYSEFNTEEDYSAGITKLSTEIITGKVPDIICVNSDMPIQQYAAKGLLEDLYTYIDNDSELSRDKLLMLQAMETDGKLYTVSPSFSITTVMGATSMVGDTPGWTLKDLLDLMNQHPEASAFAYVDQNSIMNYMCAVDMDSFVNWQTGECNFNSQDFIELLEFAKTFPKEINYDEEMESEATLIQTGKVLLYPISLADFNEYQIYKAMFGGEVTYIGFPTSNGVGHVAALNNTISISSKCKNKDAAWSFVRILLSKDYQHNNIWYGFPTNKDAFQYLVTKAMATEEYVDEYGDTIYPVTGNEWGWDNITVKIKPLDQANYDQIMDVINNTTKTFKYDEKMFSIISEETGAFFSGVKSAQETAELIQNRISTYVNEQR